MRAEKSLGVVIVGGARGVSGEHLAAYRMLGQQARIIAICDKDEKKGTQVASENGAIFTSDYEEMLAQPGIDIVDVCSPDPLHCEHVVKAAVKGYHILCEKPLAMSLEEARRINEAVTSAGVKCMVGMVLRWQPYHMRICELIRKGAIGEPVFARYQHTGCFFPYPKGSFNSRKEAKGQFLHNGVHFVDEICDFLAAAPCSVYAVTQSHFTPEYSLETPNYCFASIGMSGGQIVEIEYNQLLVDPPCSGNYTRILIVGTTGTLEYADRAGKGLLLRRGNTLQPLPLSAPLERGVGFAGEIEHFLECVRGNASPAVPLDVSIRVLAACLGALESAATRRTIAIS